MSGSGMIVSQRDVVPVDYPWKGAPRIFSAIAMPQGDRRLGVEGQMVLVIEDRRAALPKERLLSRDEAADLHRQLGAALKVFEVGEAFDAVTPYPFVGHRSLAEIDADVGEAA